MELKLSHTNLKSAIIQNPLVIPPETTVLDAIHQMSSVRTLCKTDNSSDNPLNDVHIEARSSCVLVLEDKKLVGIWTERDVVQLITQKLTLEKLLIRDVMSRAIVTLKETDFTDLIVAVNLLHQHQIRHLPVLDNCGCVAGLLTHESLRQAEFYKLAEVLEQKVSRLEAEKVELLTDRATELEQQIQERTAALRAKVEQERLISTVASQILMSLDLQDILKITVEEIQAVLKCDRVALWQIETDGQLLAVAEATSNNVKPLVGRRVTDPCFIPNWLEKYQAGRVRVVGDIYATPMQEGHRALLAQLQIRAKVLIPILHDNLLWGLLEATESDSPRQWHAEEVQLLQQLATQLAIAIQQATTYQQAHAELIERRQTEVRLKESEQRFATLAAAAPVGIFRANPDGHCLYVNERWCSITGLTPTEAAGMGWLNGLHPDDRHKITDEWLLASQENRPFQFEYRLQQAAGEITWVFGQAVAERDSNGDVKGYVGTITDISDLKQAQQLIFHNALHDPLTNLPNRTLLMERIELAINRSCQAGDYQYAVLFLDLDRFKVINDSLGHLVGDQLLTTIAQKLKTHIRSADLVARLGGDEFVILLEDVVHTEDIIHIAERILADCQTPLVVNGYEMFTSLSIGIVVGKAAYQEASELIRDADIAMYRAKAQGRNSYKFFDARMHTQALKRLTLETELRKAIEQQEFIVYYQPIMDIVNNRLIGFEALVRWQHPERGFISPGDFIPIAEEIGMIVPIDSWVFQTACQQMARWNQAFSTDSSLKISINLSAQDLRKGNLIEEINHRLMETGLAGNALCLEVTEGLLIEDIEQTIELLSQLRARGIQVSIDDFGTGYSSLSYLHRLPADALKIDRSFVGQMQQGDRDYKVVSTIISLSNQLGLDVVAEGIETQQQLQWLQQLGCEFGQGYLFSKPLAAVEIETIFLGANSAV